MAIRFQSDWKFLAMFIATIVGIIIPILIWQADNYSKSLVFEEVLRTPLTPSIKESDTLSKIQVTADGIVIQSPYLTHIDLVNNGTNPIVPTDFQSPIQLLVDEKTKIIKVGVEKTFPEDLSVEISTQENHLSIMPQLLNHNDRIRLAIITSGQSPKFQVRARIVGISVMPIIDRKTFDLGSPIIWPYIIAMFALLVAGSSTNTIMSRYASLYVITVTCMVAGGISYTLFSLLDIWTYIAITILFIPAFYLGTRINKIGN